MKKKKLAPRNVRKLEKKQLKTIKGGSGDTKKCCWEIEGSIYCQEIPIDAICDGIEE